MIDEDIQISISERSSGWATNYYYLTLGLMIWADPPEHVEDAGKVVRVSGDFRHHDSCREKSQKKTKSYIILIPWSVLSTSKKTILVQILDFHDSLHPRHHMYIQWKVSRVNKTLFECFEFPTLSFCSCVNDQRNCQNLQKNIQGNQ